MEQTRAPAHTAWTKAEFGIHIANLIEINSQFSLVGPREIILLAHFMSFCSHSIILIG